MTDKHELFILAHRYLSSERMRIFETFFAEEHTDYTGARLFLLWETDALAEAQRIRPEEVFEIHNKLDFSPTQIKHLREWHKKQESTPP